MKQQEWIKGNLEKLDFVEWDRYFHTKTGLVFYGWITRKEDPYKDFLVLELNTRQNMVVRYDTSSEKYTAEIADRLGLNHSECIRVEESFNIHNSKPLYGPEMIAVLAHRLWTHWSQHIAKEESISQERLERWESLWVEFEALSSEMREKDDELVKRFLKEKPDYDLDL
jgi:hypothetical protein